MNVDLAIDLTGDDVPTVGAKRQRPPYGEILLRGRKLIDVAEGEHLNKLASIFTNAAVLAACRAECRVHLSAGAAAQRFTISRRGLPPRVYQGDELQNVSLAAAFAGPRGRLHLELSAQLRAPAAWPAPAAAPAARPAAAPPARLRDHTWVSSMEPEVVDVHYNTGGGQCKCGAPKGDGKDKCQAPMVEWPVIYFQNVDGARGARLATVFGVEEGFKEAMASPAVEKSKYDSRKQIDRDSSLGPAMRAKEAASRLIERAEKKLKELADRGDGAAATALKSLGETQMAWGGTALIAYEAGATLKPHVDGCGSWVVIFSFGRTVNWHCGGTNQVLESGDAVLFNGGTKAMHFHGIEKVWDDATKSSAKGNPATGPVPGLTYLKDHRVSVQLRQRDPPAWWGWPPPKARDGA